MATFPSSYGPVEQRARLVVAAGTTSSTRSLEVEVKNAVVNLDRRYLSGTFGTPNIQSNILSQLTVTQPPTPTTQNIIAQYGPNSGFTTSVCTVEKHSSNLMERTWNLRDWLRQTCVESTEQSRSNDSIKNSPQSIEKFASKRHSLGDSGTRFVDVDSMYLHVFLNQFKKTCFR